MALGLIRTITRELDLQKPLTNRRRHFSNKRRSTKHQRLKDARKFAKTRQQMRKPGCFNGDIWNLVTSRSLEVQTQDQLQSVVIVIAKVITPVLATRIVKISQQRQSESIRAAFSVTIASLVSRRSRKSSEKVKSSTDFSKSKSMTQTSETR